MPLTDISNAAVNTFLAKHDILEAKNYGKGIEPEAKAVRKEPTTAKPYVLPTDYQAFIHKSRYARWIEGRARRESWEETVCRYFDFMQQHLRDNNGYHLEPELREELQMAVLKLEVMPSMRALMTAGPALEKCHIAGYNCSYVPVDHPYAIDEILYILMNGTGVGFSVEQQYVRELPPVPEGLSSRAGAESGPEVAVADSREGWAVALRQVLAALWAGKVPSWDVSKVRKAGAPLKTFGGTASGPGPLVSLFEFATALFRNAAGRQLTSLEVHDLVCKAAEIVVVGGVRRSALISLSDLDDEEMREAKQGSWWEGAGHRSMANNSAVYRSKPSPQEFAVEWAALRSSGSGERGLFSRDAAQNQAARNGRRASGLQFGTNPCSEIILRPYQFCNLTEVVVRASDTPDDLMRKARAASILGTFQATLTDFKYLRQAWRSNTAEERLLGVSLTGIMDNRFTAGLADDGALKRALETMRQHVVDTNAQFAAALGIPAATAATCVKPSGTVSQLVDAASGIHPRHSKFYIRRVRGDRSDALTRFLAEAGVPCEPCVMRPDSTVVFSFPMKAPQGAVTRDSLDAIAQLKLCQLYQHHWCEHKPSVTINVREEEWDEVGRWVYRHFESISGVSFLPYDGGCYQQMPYEECTAAQYHELAERMPAAIDFSSFTEQRGMPQDNTYELACSAGACEMVDIV